MALAALPPRIFADVIDRLPRVQPREALPTRQRRARLPRALRRTAHIALDHALPARVQVDPTSPRAPTTTADTTNTTNTTGTTDTTDPKTRPPEGLSEGAPPSPRRRCGRAA